MMCTNGLHRPLPAPYLNYTVHMWLEQMAYIDHYQHPFLINYCAYLDHLKPSGRRWHGERGGRLDLAKPGLAPGEQSRKLQIKQAFSPVSSVHSIVALPKHTVIAAMLISMFIKRNWHMQNAIKPFNLPITTWTGVSIIHTHTHTHTCMRTCMHAHTHTHSHPKMHIGKKCQGTAQLIGWWISHFAIPCISSSKARTPVAALTLVAHSRGKSLTAPSCGIHHKLLQRQRWFSGCELTD